MISRGIFLLLIEMSEETVQASKKLLGQIIKKTPLTEKLLSRPPFRYLHDLTMEIIKATGFGQQLFSESEQDSANVTVLYMQNLI